MIILWNNGSIPPEHSMKNVQKGMMIIVLLQRRFMKRLCIRLEFVYSGVYFHDFGIYQGVATPVSYPDINKSPWPPKEGNCGIHCFRMFDVIF